ncbi:MAG TPA: sensor histidine kinase, partial [Candidatus Janibacter merdipullorum]|nr:sensor histidine kinase [Candidatus Janibacter merdipullorum]
IGNSDTWHSVSTTGQRHLAVLCLIIVALIPLLGLQALTMLPYVVALGMFSLPLGWAFAVAGAGVGMSLIVPLLDGSFTDEWYFALIVLLVAVATGLVRVLEQGGDQARAAEAELTLATERDRVARDVHDVLGHSLTVISLKADLAERLLDRDPAMAKGEIVDIQRLTRQSLAEIRATVAGLRVARLADERDTAADALRDAGITARLPEDGDVVDPGHRITMAWALREAVTNVIRHSGAKEVEVTWGPTWLQVVDDGRGLRGRKEGSGLTGLRERVRQAGGRIEVTEGIPGQAGPGTTLRVDLS